MARREIRQMLSKLARIAAVSGLKKWRRGHLREPSPRHVVSRCEYWGAPGYLRLSEFELRALNFGRVHGIHDFPSLFGARGNVLNNGNATT